MAFDIINPNGKANIVLVSEHASNNIPDEFDNLGLTDEQLELHIAWDIGIGEVTKNLAENLDAPAIVAGFSRLLIDPNRATTQQGLIPLVSDGHTIHGNQNLDVKEIHDRIDLFYLPFHRNTQQLIEQKEVDHHAPIIFNMHSFTPNMNGELRPWHGGLLYNTDDRVAKLLNQRLEAKGYHIGDNEPYSGKDLFYTMNTHGLARGLPHVNIEIRQNEIDHVGGIQKWSNILTEVLSEISSHPELAKKI